MWLMGVSAVMLAVASLGLFVGLTRHPASTSPLAQPGGDNQAAPGSGSDQPSAAGPTGAVPSAASPAPTAKPTVVNGPGSGGVAGPNTPNCSPKPSACGLPDATNTGVPAGTALSVTTGDVDVSQPGAVLEGRDIRGCVTITAPNVTIRRSKITCTFGYGVQSAPTGYSGGPVTIEDTEIDCAGSGATAIGYANTIARRLNVHGCENGFDIDSTTTVVDSYIHDMRATTVGHTDGIQLAGGAHIVIQHNTIFNPGGTSAIISNPNQNSDVLIDANLLGGGAYTLYCPRDSSTDFRVTNNRFSTMFSPQGGEYGPWDACEKVAVLSGNVWDATLRPL